MEPSFRPQNPLPVMCFLQQAPLQKVLQGPHSTTSWWQVFKCRSLYTGGTFHFLTPTGCSIHVPPVKQSGTDRVHLGNHLPGSHPFPSKSWPWHITWCAECRVQESDVDPEQLDVSLGTRAERFKVELKLYRWLRTWTQNCHWEWLWPRSLWTSQKYVTLNLHLWEDPKYVQLKKIKGLGTHSREQLWLPLWVGQGKRGQS